MQIENRETWTTEVAHPKNDSVIALKRWDELISTDDFRLIQWAKTTQHLNVAFCVSYSHREELDRASENREGGWLKASTVLLVFWAALHRQRAGAIPTCRCIP